MRVIFGQPVRGGDPHLGAGGVPVFLGLAHIRALRHELRRKAQGQFLWQLQTRKLKLLGWALAGEVTAEGRQEVALLSQLFEQRWQCGRDLREL